MPPEDPVVTPSPNAPSPSPDTPAAPAAPPAPPAETLEEAMDKGIEAAGKSEQPAAPAAAGETGQPPAGDDDAEGGKPAGDAAAKPDDKGEAVGDDGEGDKDKNKADDKDDQPPAEEADKGKKPDGATDPDHLNDPIPAQVSDRTRTRMTWLIDRVKQQDAIVAQQRELVTEITSTGVSPENFGATLEILRCFNSPNLDDKRKAFNALLTQARELGQIIGEPVPGEDPLEGHEDLQKDVAENKMTPERAVELAITRNRAAAVERQRQHSVRATQAYQQAQQSARVELNALGTRLAARDPHYAAKAAIVFEAIKDELPTLHPSKWRERFLEEYTVTPAPKSGSAPPPPPPPGGAPPPPPPPRGPGPLRPHKQPAGGGGPKAPSNPLEALEAGLEAAARNSGR